MDPLPYEKCNPTDDEVRPRLHMRLDCANWKKKKRLANHLYATVVRNSQGAAAQRRVAFEKAGDGGFIH